MSPRLPALRPREVLRAREHPTKPGRIVTVPVHPGDLKRSVLASILKQAGLTTEEFLDLV